MHSCFSKKDAELFYLRFLFDSYSGLTFVFHQSLMVSQKFALIL